MEAWLTPRDLAAADEAFVSSSVAGILPVTRFDGREIGSGSAFDGRSIYLIADGVDVIVVDARTYELTDVIEPLTFVDHLNALAVGPGALWVATGDAGILQRFDIPS